MTQPDPTAARYGQVLAESAAWSGGLVQARTDPPPGPPREAPPAEQGRGRSWLRRLLG